MKSVIKFAAALVVAGALSARAEAAPLEAYGRLPAIEDVAMAPDGGHVAVTVTNGDQRKIAIRSLSDGATYVMDTGDVKVRDVAWADGGTLLITTTVTTDKRNIVTSQGEFGQLFAYDLESRTLKQQMRDETVLLQAFDTPMLRTTGDKTTVLLSGPIYADQSMRWGLVQLNLERGTTRVVDAGFKDTTDWLVDSAGAPLAESEYDPKSGKWQLRTRSGGKWIVSRSLVSLQERPGIAGLGRDGASVLMSELVEGELVYREVDPVTGTWGEPLADANGATPIFDPGTHRLIGFSRQSEAGPTYSFFDPLDARIWKAVTSAYPGDSTQLVSWSADHRRLVVLVDSATTGPAYALVDLSRKSATWLGDEYPGLKSADISPVERFTYKAADGLELSAFLTTPKGREAKNLPLIVLPHGGPAVAETVGFDWWSQALASRGYAVLRVNYRGSDGEGWEMIQAGFGEWGRKMQTDLSDGVRFLAQRGSIDPKRVCITGASYGGYAALAGMTLDSGVYRCAAAVSGIGDIKAFLAFSHSEKGLGSLRWWTRFMGLEKQNDTKALEISPIAHLAAVKGPILMVHGKDDTVVPYEQSLSMDKALRGAGKSSELVTLEGEDHWMSRGATRQQMLSAVVGFLEKHNPPN